MSDPIMSKFRKKPVVIDAFQWTAQPIKAWRDLDAWLVSLGLPTCDEADGSDDGSALWVNGDESLTIPTLEGDMRCDVGDWIIRGVKGEFYPCKPDIFALTYEPVAPSVSVEDATSAPDAWMMLDRKGECVGVRQHREDFNEAEEASKRHGWDISVIPLYRRAPSSTERSPE